MGHLTAPQSAAVYVFDSSLDNHDRAVVHNLCKKFGMTSKSHGCELCPGHSCAGDTRIARPLHDVVHHHAGEKGSCA